MAETTLLPPHWGLWPVMFHIGPLAVPSYSVFVLLAFVAGALWYFRATPRTGADTGQVITIFAAAFLGGVIGAKLPNWILHFGHLKVHPEGLLYSGKTIVGGLLGGMLAVIAVKRILGIRRRLGNTIAPAVALGMAVGRLGCLCRGCCYGRPTVLPWGIDFGDGIARHPTQIYEALFDFALFLLLWRLQKRVQRPGALFGIFMSSYLPARFLLEFLRVEPRLWPGLTAFQWAAAAGCVWVWWKYFAPGNRREAHEHT